MLYRISNYSSHTIIMETKLLHSLLFIYSSVFYCSSQDSYPMKQGASVELVADGFKFTEGPADDKEGNVYFTDQPNDQILKWDRERDTVLVYMDDAARSIRLFIGNDEALYVSADENSQLWKIESPE